MPLLCTIHSVSAYRLLLPFFKFSIVYLSTTNFIGWRRTLGFKQLNQNTQINTNTTCNRFFLRLFWIVLSSNLLFTFLCTTNSRKTKILIEKWKQFTYFSSLCCVFFYCTHIASVSYQSVCLYIVHSIFTRIVHANCCSSVFFFFIYLILFISSFNTCYSDCY